VLKLIITQLLMLRALRARHRVIDVDDRRHVQLFWHILVQAVTLASRRRTDVNAWDAWDMWMLPYLDLASRSVRRNDTERGVEAFFVVPDVQSVTVTYRYQILRTQRLIHRRKSPLNLFAVDRLHDHVRHTFDRRNQNSNHS